MPITNKNIVYMTVERRAEVIRTIPESLGLWPDDLDIPKDDLRAQIHLLRRKLLRANRDATSFTADEREALWHLAYSVLSSSKRTDETGVWHSLMKLWVDGPDDAEGGIE